VAVNGKPVWISGTKLMTDRPIRIQLGYSSVDTRILIGPLEAWVGVKRDIVWR
jgi:hypothetical protein